jgi:hypothetical protein
MHSTPTQGSPASVARSFSDFLVFAVFAFVGAGFVLPSTAFLILSNITFLLFLVYLDQLDVSLHVPVVQICDLSF